jgi:hypothetical protein
VAARRSIALLEPRLAALLAAVGGHRGVLDILQRPVRALVRTTCAPACATSTTSSARSTSANTTSTAYSETSPRRQRPRARGCSAAPWAGVIRCAVVVVGGEQAAKRLVERALVAAEGEHEFAAPGLHFAVRGAARRRGRERRRGVIIYDDDACSHI